MPARNDEHLRAETKWLRVVDTTLDEVDALMVAVRFSPVPLGERVSIAVEVLEMRRALIQEKKQLTQKGY